MNMTVINKVADDQEENEEKEDGDNEAKKQVVVKKDTTDPEKLVNLAIPKPIKGKVLTD